MRLVVFKMCQIMWTPWFQQHLKLAFSLAAGEWQYQTIHGLQVDRRVSRLVIVLNERTTRKVSIIKRNNYEQFCFQLKYLNDFHRFNGPIYSMDNSNYNCSEPTVDVITIYLT